MRLAIFCLLVGTAVEVLDVVLGDPFEPLDVITLALILAGSVLVWPGLERAWRSW